MATYAELLQAEQDAALNNRVRVAIVVAAELIRLETTGSNLANRKAWAKEAFIDPFGKSKQMLWAVLAQNRAATLAQIVGADDATVQTAVNAAVDAFATGA